MICHKCGVHIYFVSDRFEDWHCYDVLTLMIWMSSSHTIEFYFDARKKYRPGCHDMVDTFLCYGGFFIASRGCHSRRDDVVDTFPRHGYYTLHLFAFFCTTFSKSTFLIVFIGKFRSSSSSFQSFSNIWSNL